MFEFCPHCGGSIGQEQVTGKLLVCRACGKPIGVVAAAPTAIVDRAQELIRSGAAERCSLCGQLVAVKVRDGVRAFVPHRAAGKAGVCPNSGKPLTASPNALGPGELREVIRVVRCERGANPSIEELTLEVLDPADRVRLHVEALRAILGSAFRMADYPAALARPQLARWTSAIACVVGKRHPGGGLQPLSDAEIAEVVDDLAHHRALFFA